MPLASSTVSETLALTEPVVLVQKDLKKSALIIGSIIVLIIGLFFIDGRTNFLISAADKLFQVLHLQI